MLKIKDKLKRHLFGLKIWFSIKMGYIDEEGRPLKCSRCKCKKFYKGESWSDDICGFYQEVEYILYCQNCKCPVGHWAYGYWDF